MRTRRTKEQIRKDIYNRDVDAYNFYVVNLDTMKAETGFEFKEDAVDVLNDYDDKKKYKVVSKKALKSLGVENPNESFKYEAGGDFQSGVYAKGGGVKINTEVILSENRPNGAEWQGVVKPFMLKSIEENQYAGGFKRYEIDIYDEVDREPTKEEIKKANEFFDKIGGRYAGGGKIKPFMYKENNSTIMINGTKADVKKMYLDYKNNFLSVSRFAEYYNISERQANSIIESGRKYAKEDGYYAGGGEFMTDPTFGNFQNNVYANGGVTNNYVPRRNLNTITIKKGNQKLTYKISDVLNGAYKLESGAKLEDIAFYVPKRSIVKVQLKTGKDFKPANGYWIKDGAKPINISKFDDGGSINNLSREEFMKKEIDNQKEKEKSINFKKYKVNVFEEGYPFVEPLMTNNFIEAINFAKKTIESQRGYRSTSKDLFAEIDKFQQIEERGNVRYPYSSFASFSEEDLNTSKFDEGGVMSRLLTRKKDQPKVETTNEDIDLNEDSRIRVRPSSFVRKDKEGDWMMKKNSSKEARSYAGGGKVDSTEEDKLMAENNIVLLEGNPTISGQILARKNALKEIELSEKSGESDVYPSMLQNWKKSHKETIKKLEKLKEANSYAGGGKTETPTKKGRGNHKMKATTDLAKKIRKDGEKWTDALRRASQQMK
jgi:hypothetical protein